MATVIRWADRIPFKMQMAIHHLNAVIPAMAAIFWWTDSLLKDSGPRQNEIEYNIRPIPNR